MKFFPIKLYNFDIYLFDIWLHTMQFLNPLD